METLAWHSVYTRRKVGDPLRADQGEPFPEEEQQSGEEEESGGGGEPHGGGALWRIHRGSGEVTIFLRGSVRGGLVDA